MAYDRPRFPLEISAERVEESEGDFGYRATMAVETAEGLPPIVAHVSLSRAAYVELDGTIEGRRAAVDDLCTEAAERALRASAGLGAKDDPRDTVRDLATDPRIGHQERAGILAELVRTKGAEMAKNHGPDWLVAMLASEFRAVYADGERKGYAVGKAPDPIA